MIPNEDQNEGTEDQQQDPAPTAQRDDGQPIGEVQDQYADQGADSTMPDPGADEKQESDEEEVEAVSDGRIGFTITEAPQSPVQVGINGRLQSFPVGQHIRILRDDADAVFGALDNGNVTYVKEGE